MTPGAGFVRNFPLAEFARPRWATFLKYGKQELLPPSPGEIPEAFRGAARLVKSATTFQWRHLTVREAWLNTLVGIEVACWSVQDKMLWHLGAVSHVHLLFSCRFFVGECIGKRSLVAYKV